MKCFSVFLLFFILFFFVGLAEADTHTVEGKTDKDIQKTFNKAGSGDTIIFPEGDYPINNVVVSKKDLKIKGEGTVIFHINTGSSPGLIFSGSAVTKTHVSSDANIDSSEIQIPDASKVKKGDLVKIWKNVKWCPKDYAKQLTGEMYKVKSVSGDTITLNEPLIRGYSSGSDVEVYRPAKIMIDNIQVQNVDKKGKVEGIRLQYCADSQITNCVFRDNGRASLQLKCCWNSVIENNEIYNSVRPGNGYGVSIYDGSAYITVKNNYIKNCRHCIMSGASSEYNSLNRDITITKNVLIGGNGQDFFVIDSHEMTINYVVTDNEIYVTGRWAAFQDGTLESVFIDNIIYVEEGRSKAYSNGEYRKRGHVSGGTHIRDNVIKIWKKTPKSTVDHSSKSNDDIDQEEDEKEENTENTKQEPEKTKVNHVFNFGFSFPLIETDLGASAIVEYNNVSYDPHSLIEVTGDDLKLIKVEYNGNVTRHFIEKDIWTGDIQHVGSDLYLPGHFKADSLKITVYSDEGYQTVSDIEIKERKLSGATSINPDLFIFIAILAISGISIARNLRRIFP